MKWIWWESKSKTANKPLYWTSFDEVAFYMPTWNCTKIKRVRRIVNAAWVDIKFWSLRRWNWKTQLVMMELDEVETIFTHTSPSYLFCLEPIHTCWWCVYVCYMHLSTSYEIFWNLELWHRSLLILCWFKLLRSEMAISHWLHWKYLESGQRACGGDRCQRLSCNKFHRQTGRGHHCAASQVSRGISRLGIYSTCEQTNKYFKRTAALPQMFLRSSNQNC